MAVVTITLPVHSQFQTNRLRWRDQGPSGLGNVDDLLATDPFGVLIQFQVRGDRGDDLNNLQIRVGDADRALETPGPELSDAWEANANAITVQVPGLSDLVIPGPTNANVQQMDSAEPYIWTPGDDYAAGAISYTSGGVAAGLGAWVADYLAAYAADNTCAPRWCCRTKRRWLRTATPAYRPGPEIQRLRLAPKARRLRTATPAWQPEPGIHGGPRG